MVGKLHLPGKFFADKHETGCPITRWAPHPAAQTKLSRQHIRPPPKRKLRDHETGGKNPFSRGSLDTFRDGRAGTMLAQIGKHFTPNKATQPVFW